MRLGRHAHYDIAASHRGLSRRNQKPRTVQAFVLRWTKNADLRAPAPVDSTENDVGCLKLFALTWAKIRAMLAARVSASQKH